MQADTDAADFCLKTLLENNEQVNVLTKKEYGNDVDLNYMLSDRKSHLHRWFIKPRIRIDSTYAVNNPDSLVAKIIVLNFSGDTILNKDIKCMDFCTYENNSFHYDGKYHEHFYDELFHTPYFLNVKADTLVKGANYDERGKVTNQDSSKIDIQLYWYGNVDMYVDYIKFEDEWAHYLMTDSVLVSSDDIYDFKNKIQQELSIFEGLSVKTPYFLIDEYNYNMLPCIAYVDSLVRRYSGNKSGLAILTNDYWLTNCKASGLNKPPDSRFGYNSGYQFLYDSKAVKDILSTDIYPIALKIPLPPNVTLPDKSLFPGTINYRKAANNNDYDDTLIYIIENGILTGDTNEYCPSFMNRFRKCLYTCKQNGINNFAVMLPYFTDEGYLQGPYNGREPTVEEMNMVSCIALAYNANILIEFAMLSKKLSDTTYFWGLTDVPELIQNTCNYTFNNRENNYYEQPKWDSVQVIGNKLRAIGEYIFPSDDQNNIKRLNHYKTVTVDDAFENHQLPPEFFHRLPESYVTDIQSVIYNSSTQKFDTTLQDPSSKRYWELGFFDKRNSEPLDKSMYLFAVNKRCIPGGLDSGDYRQLRIKFNGNYLSLFKNWLIKDAISDSVINTFPGNTTNYVIAGVFQPGEGKLLKLAPVMQEGGTLVCDENVTTSVTCKGEVFAEDKVINIGNQLTISFTSNGGFNFSGGEFHSGNPAQSGIPGPVFTSVSGQKWNGIKLTDGIKSYISKSTFNNIKQDTNAIEFYDCLDIRVENSNFTCPQDENSGSLMLNFTLDEIKGPYIYQNTFTSNSSSYSAVKIISNASNVTPLLLEQNNFTASGGENAIFLSGVTGGAIKCNTITNYSKGIHFLLSNLDIYNNTISSNLDSAKGIYGFGSEINIGAENYFLGGKNNISLGGNAGADVKVEDSYFNMDRGKNLFNIKQSSGSYHLFGYFPENYQGSEVVYCRGNCFKADNTAIDSAIWYITLGPEGDLMTFDFSEMDCNLDFSCDCEDEEVFELGDSINDTVCITGQGAGGGEKVAGAVAGAVEFMVYKELKDSINVNTRKREYITLENQCRRILLQYPDSSGSRECIMKLYLSVLQQNDTTKQKMSALKSFLEQLITDNPNNPKLIIRAFYTMQKCKVSLEEYASALLGFQYIMNNNPYSIEGLLSSWDYSVVQLLMGSGGAERDEEIKDEPKDSLIIHIVKSEKTEKSKEQSKIKYYRGIESVLQSENSKQEERIRNFEKKNEKVEKPVENRSIGKEEIEILKKIKDAVKIKKPKSREEHIKIVNTDIRNIFGIKSKQSGTGIKNIIPTEYSLSQNYPNPFNPVTKISFALPKESKVKLIIYDMLGREVARLINNENLSAGTYIREFNGSNLASGVYFLRILVNDGKDFTDVKKIVLLK